MKKCRLWVIFGILMLFQIIPVEAASFGMSASKTKVAPNSTFTVSVGGDCIGRVNLSISGGTLSTTSVWVEQNYQTVTVRAGSSGTVTIVATPAEGFSDADANLYSPGARSVNVVVSSGSTSSGTTVKPPVDTRSTNNLLASLTINSGTLNPNFDANTVEYHVDLPSTQKSIMIDAKTADQKASVTGIGERSLNPGDNTIKLTVTAENGNQKEYTIFAYVEEEPEVYFSYKEEEIGVVKNLKGVTIPTGFETKQHTINEHTFSIFDNGYFTLIYGINSKGEKGFYLFDTTKNECTSKIIPITVQDKTLYLYDLEEQRTGFKKTTINMNHLEIEGYQFEKGFSHYFLIPVFNKEGKKVDYLYEETEKTFQLYSNFVPLSEKEYQSVKKEMKQKEWIIYGLTSYLIISLGGVIFLLVKMRKDKKNEKKH